MLNAMANPSTRFWEFEAGTVFGSMPWEVRTAVVGTVAPNVQFAVFWAGFPCRVFVPVKQGYWVPEVWAGDLQFMLDKDHWVPMRPEAKRRPITTIEANLRELPINEVVYFLDNCPGSTGLKAILQAEKAAERILTHPMAGMNPGYPGQHPARATGWPEAAMEGVKGGPDAQHTYTGSPESIMERAINHPKTMAGIEIVSDTVSKPGGMADFFNGPPSDDEGWYHAACLVIAETGQMWGPKVTPSPAMKAVMELWQTKEKFRQELERQTTEAAALVFHRNSLEEERKQLKAQIEQSTMDLATTEKWRAHWKKLADLLWVNFLGGMVHDVMTFDDIKEKVAKIKEEITGYKISRARAREQLAQIMVLVTGSTPGLEFNPEEVTKAVDVFIEESAKAYKVRDEAYNESVKGFSDQMDQAWKIIRDIYTDEDDDAVITPSDFNKLREVLMQSPTKTKPNPINTKSVSVEATRARLVEAMTELLPVSAKDASRLETLLSEWLRARMLPGRPNV